MKRRYDYDDSRPQKRSSGGGQGGLPCALKFLAPDVLASAVIGKGGTVISAMRQSTGARVALTEKNELFPGTDCRVLTTQANNEEALNDVSSQIIAALQGCVESGPSDQLGEPGQLKLRALVPKAAVGGVIGKGGAVIKQLREQSGAKVSIQDPTDSGPGADQVVSITGGQRALEHVVAEINRQVQAVSHEPWFESWAGGGR
eukprot:CAMPEP_0179240454 /NCGR_PEP_ID=MMETSP0797-20121207/15981_1 /TAXON_ID=47934 /ORGANISM="Dinophysis acuminata, Strain DAEP01" /LENGTH=201 /DNA_ID=CAMNT_0020947801 /DNA_START=73 /DNA_END=675 /DNA_ORIENTATION=+